MVLDLPADGLVSVLVAVVSILVVRTGDLKRASVLFFLFCLLMAVAWVRLDLQRLGAVEVGIGALMTGFVAWRALGRLPGFPGPDTSPVRPEDAPPAALLLSLAGSAGFMGFLCVPAVWFFLGEPLTPYTLYCLAGIPAAGAGFFSLVWHRNLLRRLFAFNVLGSGIFLLIVTFAAKQARPIGVPFVMVTAGLVVAFLASLMVVIVIGRRPVTGAPGNPEGGSAHVR